jgi:hypothetical protein
VDRQGGQAGTGGGGWKRGDERGSRGGRRVLLLRRLLAGRGVGGVRGSPDLWTQGLQQGAWGRDCVGATRTGRGHVTEDRRLTRMAVAEWRARCGAARAGGVGWSPAARQ